MLRSTRKTLLTIEAVVDIALHARPDPVQSKEITRRQGVPQRYLEQVMQQLVHHGILRGVRGPKGGYTLARERRRITVGEIARIVESVEKADEESDGSTSAIGTQVVRPLWSEIEGEIFRRLDAITIEQLCSEARVKGLANERGEPRDFII